MQKSPYRTNAKPPEKEKKLPYKKPWWKVWTPKETFTGDSEQKYVWHYIKKWQIQTGNSHTSSLYYTNTDLWVTVIQTQWGKWFFYGDSLEELSKHLEEHKKTTAERSAKHLSLFKQLTDLKEKEDKGPKKVIWL